MATEIVNAVTTLGTNLGSNGVSFATATTATTAVKQLVMRQTFRDRFALAATQAETGILYLPADKFPNGATIKSVNLFSKAGVAADNTDYWTYLVKTYDAAGANGATVISTTTKAADLNALTALVGYPLTTATTPAIANTAMVVGGGVTITATKSGSGPTHDLTIEITLEAL